MTLSIHDVDGYVGDLGSAVFVDRLEREFENDPVIRGFFEKGFTDKVEELETALASAVEKVTDKDLKKGARILLDLVRLCSEGVFIHG